MEHLGEWHSPASGVPILGFLRRGRHNSAHPVVKMTNETVSMGATMNVLVVEDEALVSLEVQDLVERSGHACVGPVATVSEACQLIDTMPLEAALLDIWLKHDQFVWPAARKLAGLGVPFAFVSARAPDGIEPEFRDRPLFPKPMNETHVRRWLDDVGSGR
jgi:hypothetical protein